MARSNHTRKVLIVEDDVQYRTLLTNKLESEGIGVVSAVNGKDALSKIALDGFDLILLDLLMPEMSGWIFLYEIRKTAKKNTPVIILTNLSETSYPSDIPAQIDFLVKANTSLEDVVKRVKKHLKI